MKAVDVMKEYPFLASWNKSTYWTGFVEVDISLLLRVALKVPNFPSVEGGSLKGDEDTKKICTAVQPKIDKLFQSDCSVLAFLNSFVELVKSSRANSVILTGDPDPKFYSILLAELDQIGMDKVSFVSKNYREIHIKHEDQSNRVHLIKYILPPGYPYASVPLKVTAELPLFPENFTWPAKLLDADSWFSGQLESFDRLWSELEDLDKNTKVIDPAVPNPGHKHRRILLKDRVIVHLVLNPLNPRSFPEINISGPHKCVSELDANIDKNCRKWDEYYSVLMNLESTLSTNCRLSDSDDGEVFDLELTCAICYTYSFEGEIPDNNCDCGANYHNKCLADMHSHDFMTNLRNCVECPSCGSDLRFTAYS